MKLKDRLKAIDELQRGHKAAHKIYCTFGKMEIFGNQVCFGDGSDFVSLDELKDALELLVAECGGKIKWNEK